MAHLFLGQLVSTFDEEFRILFAQSQPLIIEQMFEPVEDFSLMQKRQYPSERPLLYRDPRKLMSLDIPQPEEWARHPYEEHVEVDWRMRPLKRRETFHGPADGYSRFPSQQAHVDPPLEQGPYRTAIMDNPAFKRHSYAEGIAGRYQFLQQHGVPEPDDHARQFPRQQPPYMGQGKETDYNKFWNQDYLADPYSEPPETEPDNFDPVLNYLSSTRNVDFDQGSDKLTPAADLPYSSPYGRRLCAGQTYACQTSPTPSNPTEQKQFFREPNLSRKDPMVKQGLRDWRISSYLSTYDGKGDEGLPLAPPDATDPFEEPSNLMQQTAPGADLPMSKIPNVRAFKVPAIPRASQIPSYAKNIAQEQTKKLPDEPSSVLTEAKRTPTPTPSESSSTTEGEKAEEAEQKEPKISLLHREDSFRRKYNAAIPRSSRLRSSLIFSSLDQQHSSPGQQDEEGDKSEAEPTKKTFVSQVLGQRKPAREPIEWSRFIKSATVDNSATDSSTPEEEKSKAEDKDSSKDENSKDLSEKQEVEESLKSVPQSKPSGPPTSLFQSSAEVDMNDPDMRLKFFKELAAKRRAEKAAEAQKAQTKAPAQLKKQTAVNKEKPDAKEATEKTAATEMSAGLSEKHGTVEDGGQKVSTAVCDSGEQTAENSNGTKRDNSQVKNDPNLAPVLKESQTEVTSDSETVGPKSSQPVVTPPVSAEPKSHQSNPAEKLKPLNPAEEKSSTSFPPTPNNSAPASDVSPKEDTVQGKASSSDSTSAETALVASSPVDSSPSTAPASVDSKIPNAESVPVVTSSHSPPQQPQQQTGLVSCSSDPSSSDQTLVDSGPKIIPGQSPSSSSPLHTPAGTISSSVTPEDSALTSSTLSPTTSPLAPSAKSLSHAKPESTQSHPYPISQLTSSETPSAADSAHLKSDQDTCGADSEPKSSSSQPSAKTDSEEPCFNPPSEKEIPKSEDRSVPCALEKESEDVKIHSTSPTHDPVSPKSKPDQNGITVQSPSPAPPSSEQAETDVTKICQDPPTQVTSQSEPDLTGLVSTPSADKVSFCPPTESAEPVLSPEAEKTLSLLHSPPHSTSLPEQVSADSNVTPVLPSKDTCKPAESPSNVPAETDQPCKTPESVISEIRPIEQPENTEDSKMDSQNEAIQVSVIPNTDEKKTDHIDAINEVNKAATQESTHCEKTKDQVKENNCSDPPEIASGGVPLSPQTKQAKTSQSRYQSSTANVLSSSNLRDDTKLLLEQISANSQSRNEANKEAPVTDDEKEDEADKKAKKGKERGAKLFNKGQPKSTQEREKLLEKIQSMRKERKVYSRFEV